jgi:hypothetical protein
MPSLDKEQLNSVLGQYAFKGSIIERWLGLEAHDQIYLRISEINDRPLSHVELNQLLLLSHEAAVSDAFFRYYWLDKPDHPYDLDSIPGYQSIWSEQKMIISLEHFKWGIHRIYSDCLLYFGNIRRGFRALRSKNFREIRDSFVQRRFDTAAIRKRGAALHLHMIEKDDRYLISEMACKSYGQSPHGASDLKNALIEAWREHQNGGGKAIRLKTLLDGEYVKRTYEHQQLELQFSADEIVEEQVSSEDELIKKYEQLATRFSNARASAMKNTDLYLSMINDLDVYVATSMRTRKDFRDMGDNCEKIFADPRLRELNLRYFDPTLSAAGGHEDKGLIECLMVKSAKVLIYCAGEKDSYGKDAEAAMALSLGKPVIIFCEYQHRERFFRDIHPLSRLIEFSSGIAVGAMVTSSLSDVSELLYRLFENKMQYDLDQPKPAYLRLKEKLTGSVVRLQTNNELLSEIFWNYYHHRPHNEDTTD